MRKEADLRIEETGLVQFQPFGIHCLIDCPRKPDGGPHMISLMNNLWTSSVRSEDWGTVRNPR